MKLVIIIFCVIALFCSCNSHQRKYGNKQSNRTETVVLQKPAQLQEIKKGAEFPITIVGITDGDTFKGLTSDNQQIKCRIYGIDAPEKKQAYGQKSKQYLSDLIFGKRVHIKIQGKSFDRYVVWVYIDGKDISAEMIKAGMAWHYKEYDKSEEYSNLESIARNNRIGLWNDSNPVVPRNFRKVKK